MGGSVTGLAGTIVLQNGLADDLTMTANGPFTFATRHPDGARYAVTVKTSPPGQTCAITGARGTIAGADVTASR